MPFSRCPRLSARWFVIGVVAFEMANAGCLPEGPPGRGQLVHAHDGLTRVFPAHGPEGEPDPVWIFGGRASADDGSVDGGLYRLAPGQPATRLGRTTLRLDRPWSFDGAFWFFELDETGAPPWRGQLQRVAADGRVVAVETPPKDVWDHGAPLLAVGHVGAITWFSVGDGEAFAWHGTTPLPLVNDVYRIGDWYIGTRVDEATGEEDLVRFRDDDLTPRVLLPGVTWWQFLPVVTHQGGWIVANTATDDRLLIDPITGEIAHAPVPLRTRLLVHPEGRLVATFPTITAERRDEQLMFIDTATWTTETQILNGSVRLDTWRAVWRPGHDEVWVSSWDPPALFAASPGAPARSWPGYSMDLRFDPPGDLLGLNVSRGLHPVFDVGSYASSFGESGEEQAFSSDGRELLVSRNDDRSSFTVQWLDVDALGEGGSLASAPLRPIVEPGAEPRRLLPGTRPGEVWAEGTFLDDRRLYFSSRAQTAGEAPVLVQKGRGVARFFVSGDRALATLESRGEPARGELVLLDAHGPDVWLGSQVIDFWPLAACPGCDHLAAGASLAYVVNALRPWERNGLWTTTLP